MGIVIEHLFQPTPEAAELIAELDAVLGAVYEPHQRHGLSLEQVFEPHVRFFIARLDGDPVGCGAIALFDGYAEVKRMYTRERARGRGIGKAILGCIEDEARAAGLLVLRLETGTQQHAAIELYKNAGFAPCGPFGPYAEMPSRRIAESLFYEKPL